MNQFGKCLDIYVLHHIASEEINIILIQHALFEYFLLIAKYGLTP